MQRKTACARTLIRLKTKQRGATIIVPPALSRHRVLGGARGPGPGLRGGGLFAKELQSGKKGGEAKKSSA